MAFGERAIARVCDAIRKLLEEYSSSFTPEDLAKIRRKIDRLLQDSKKTNMALQDALNRTKDILQEFKDIDLPKLREVIERADKGIANTVVSIKDMTRTVAQNSTKLTVRAQETLNLFDAQLVQTNNVLTTADNALKTSMAACLLVSSMYVGRELGKMVPRSYAIDLYDTTALGICGCASWAVGIDAWKSVSAIGPTYTSSFGVIVVAVAGALCFSLSRPRQTSKITLCKVGE